MGIHCEKKINLEDIERDNLRAEDVSKLGNTRSEEAKYSTKPEIGQQQYQIQNQYNGPPNSQVAYVTPSSVREINEFLWRFTKFLVSLSFIRTGPIGNVRSSRRIRYERTSLPAAKYYPTGTDTIAAILQRVPATVPGCERNRAKYLRNATIALPTGSERRQSTAVHSTEGYHGEVFEER